MTTDEARAALLECVAGFQDSNGLRLYGSAAFTGAVNVLIAAVRAEYAEHVDRYQDGYANGKADAEQELAALREAAEAVANESPRNRAFIEKWQRLRAALAATPAEDERA